MARHPHDDHTTTSSYSVFYHISRASNCTFWANRDGNSNHTDATLSPPPTPPRNFADRTHCCASCLQLFEIIQTEQTNTYSTAALLQYAIFSGPGNDSNCNRNDERRGATAPRQPPHSPYLLSHVTGGTILHALLQSYYTHCPQLVYTFVGDDNEYFMTPSTETSGIFLNYHQSLMLLHRDRRGKLPIHLAVSILHGSSHTLSNHLFQLLLRRTLIAQQQCLSLQYSINPPNASKSQIHNSIPSESRGILRFCFPICLSDWSCDYLPPHILSRDTYGCTILDTMLRQYIVTDRSRSDHDFHNRHHDSRLKVLLDNERYRKIVRQVVDQTIRCSEIESSEIHHQFMQRISMLIIAAYRELLVLQHCYRNRNHNNVSNENSGRIPRDGVKNFCCQIANETFMETEDDKYILHYASALSGPNNIIAMHHYEHCRTRCAISTTLPNTSNTTSPTSRKVSLMQVERSILDLLLHCWGEEVLRLPHPSTGQVPLHYAVQSHSSILYTDHQHIFQRSNAKNNVDESMFDNNVDDWLQWVRTLLRIYPEACIVKDRHGYIPLHYAILQTGRDCNCRSDGTTDERCRALSLSRFRLIHALISAYPPSIDIACRIKLEHCASDRHWNSSPHQLRMCTNPDYVGDDEGATPDSQCTLEIFQIAALIYHPPYNDNFDMLLTIIYTLLRMSPSRLCVCDIYS